MSHEGGWGGPGSPRLSLYLPPVSIKRIRDKYEVELQELERSERKLQERCNELKGRLAELEGDSIRLQGLLKHKEQEVEEIRKVSMEQSLAWLCPPALPSRCLHVPPVPAADEGRADPGAGQIGRAHV